MGVRESARGPRAGGRRIRCGIPEPYTLRLSRRIPAQPGYSREGEGGPYPENFGRVPRERLSAPRLPGVLETARGAGIVWVPCGVPFPRVPVGGPERDGTVTAGEPGMVPGLGQPGPRSLAVSSKATSLCR